MGLHELKLEVEGASLNELEQMLDASAPSSFRGAEFTYYSEIAIAISQRPGGCARLSSRIDARPESAEPGGAHVRAAEITGIAGCSGAGVIEKLWRALDSSSNEVRVQEMIGIKEFLRREAADCCRRNAAPQNRSEAFGVLQLAACAGPSVGVRIAADLLDESPFPEVRAVACEALAAYGVPVEEYLSIVQRQDSDPAVRDAAKEALLEYRLGQGKG